MYASIKCVKDVDTDPVAPSLLKATLTVWITIPPSFLTAHILWHTYTHHRCRIAFKWRAPPMPRVGGPAYN